MTIPTPSHLTVLFAHGSSSEKWQREMYDLVKEALALSNSIDLAYMELCQPDLEAVIRKHGGSSLASVNVLPLFLSTGKHLQKCIPEQIAAMKALFGIPIELLPPIGEHPLLRRAIKEITKEAITALPTGEKA